MPMSHQVTLKPSNHVFTVRDGETLLEAAIREGFPLPYGCRNGACGSCKGKILEGRVGYGRHDANTLTDEDKAKGLALFCAAQPLTDLIIEAREVGLLRNIVVKTLPCRVRELVRAGPDVMVLKLQLPASEKLVFYAGQYVDILMKEGGRRSYSLANPPHVDGEIELHVRNNPGGSFTDLVFNRMKAKDILRFEGPLGSFFLREDSDKPILFVASGTGFAPIKAIVEHAFHKGIRREMVLYWGNRSLSDLYLAELAGRWQQEHPNFTFIPVLSEPKPEDHWTGRTGLVHRAVMDDFDSLAGYQVYACGAPVMVEAAHRDFTRERALPEDEFYSDAFTPSPAAKPAG